MLLLMTSYKMLSMGLAPNRSSYNWRLRSSNQLRTSLKQSWASEWRATGSAALPSDGLFGGRLHLEGQPRPEGGSISCLVM